MKKPSFESASGLRPATAFLAISGVLCAVCTKAWLLTSEGSYHQPLGARSEEFLPAPDFDILDCEGRQMALSVQRMDLRLSPRSMWQAHTPGEMARKVAPLLGDEFDAETLLEGFLVPAKSGVIRVRSKRWLLDYEEARRVEAWAHSLKIADSFYLVREEERPRWRIHWRPEELLATAMRAAHSEDRDRPIKPIQWSRRLADGLALARWPEGGADGAAKTWDELEHRRMRVWDALFPVADTIVVEELPPGSVVDLIALLDDERVKAHQMQIRFETERVYPVRSDAPSREAFKVLGSWRYVDEEEALRLALQADPKAGEKAIDKAVRHLLDRKFPRAGLEGASANLLAREEFGFIQPRSASYRFRHNRPVLQPSRRYYFDDSNESDTPKVYTTFDTPLQRFLHEILGEAGEENDAAVAMGIVVDVATGDVLAVDGRSRYEVAEFLPTWHLFSPGSTFKVIVMATALEAGVVEPFTEFDTHDGNYRLPNSKRVIHEARNAPTGLITATTALSRSVNAVMVQIGTRVDDDFFAATLDSLKYAQVPASGIGKERAGAYPKLPWKPAWAHASVSFGHEITVSLWQHAAAIATVMRGGTYQPLRVLSGVEYGEWYYGLEVEAGQRVFSEASCTMVRDMMAEGAEHGTGRHITADERKLGTRIELRSKTGTTEKESGAPCLHKELRRNEYNSKLPGGRKDPNFIEFNTMKRQPALHPRSCYTSSICLVGRVPGEEREVMVMIVVEEPLKKAKFGSDVAGPTAIAVLKEALGLTRGGVAVAAVAEHEPDYGYGEGTLEDDIPWAHDEGQSW